MKRVGQSLGLATGKVAGALLALALITSMLPAAAACPNCKDAMANDTSQQGDLVHGYFYSILFMMSMPFALGGTFSLCMYRAVRKARAVEDARRQLTDGWKFDWTSDATPKLPPRDPNAS